MTELILLRCERCGREFKEPKGYTLRKVIGLFLGADNEPDSNPLTGEVYPDDAEKAIEICTLCSEAMLSYFLAKPIPQYATGVLENEKAYKKEMEEAWKP